MLQQCCVKANQASEIQQSPVGAAVAAVDATMASTTGSSSVRATNMTSRNQGVLVSGVPSNIELQSVIARRTTDWWASW